MTLNRHQSFLKWYSRKPKTTELVEFVISRYPESWRAGAQRPLNRGNQPSAGPAHQLPTNRGAEHIAVDTTRSAVIKNRLNNGLMIVLIIIII